jgi:hypothetical protein
MSFGKSAGPPASHRQIETLTELVHAAGHLDFRDARGPLGLNQRQAGGRFTRDEADALIARLEAEADGTAPPEPDDVTPAASSATRAPRARATGANRLQSVSSEMLAAELQRRGWVVMEP